MSPDMTPDLTRAWLEREALHYGRLTLICDGPEAAAAVLGHYAARIEREAS